MFTMKMLYLLLYVIGCSAAGYTVGRTVDTSSPIEFILLLTIQYGILTFFYMQLV